MEHNKQYELIMRLWYTTKFHKWHDRVSFAEVVIKHLEGYFLKRDVFFTAAVKWHTSASFFQFNLFFKK